MRKWKKKRYPWYREQINLERYDSEFFDALLNDKQPFIAPVTLDIKYDDMDLRKSHLNFITVDPFKIINSKEVEEGGFVWK